MHPPYHLIQRILFVGLTLTLMAMVSLVILEHSLRSYPYSFSLFLLIVALHEIFLGLARMREGNRQRRTVWHKQPSLLLGIALLFGALMVFSLFGIAIRLSHDAQDVVGNVAWIVFGIPSLLFLVRWGIYALKNKLRASHESE